jgi:arabinogalactan endo-1,4-beta-galactosidase
MQAQPGFKRACGCTRCEGTGYYSRVVAHETLSVPPIEHMRNKFIRAFKDKELELPINLNSDNGVDYISRLDTLQTLLNEGVMNWPTARQVLGLGG